MKTEDIVIIGGGVVFTGIIIAIIVKKNNAAAAAASAAAVAPQQMPIAPAATPIVFGSPVCNSTPSSPSGGSSNTPTPSGTPPPPNSPGGTGAASSAADSGLEINSATQLIINTLLDNGGNAANAASLQNQLNSALMDNDFNAQYNTFSGATKELMAQINNLWGRSTGSTRSATVNTYKNAQSSFKFLQKYNEQKAENVNNADMAYNVGIMTNYMIYLNNPQICD
jgi:hypothetical protein